MNRKWTNIMNEFLGKEEKISCMNPEIQIASPRSLFKSERIRRKRIEKRAGNANPNAEI